MARPSSSPCLRALALAALLPLPAPVGALPAQVRGRQVVVAGRPLHMKGVNWNPVVKGLGHPDGLNFTFHAEQDAELMRQGGINVVRTYEPLTDRSVLDKLWARGLQVVTTLWSNGKEPLGNITERVLAVRDHPAILMWSIGNEWNLNNCYLWSMGFQGCLNAIKDAVKLVKSLDVTHPVATVYGGLPPRWLVDSLPEVDLWGINYYNGLHMQGMLWRWSLLSQKPVFVGEYGADAYNTFKGNVDEHAQAHATTILTQKIIDYSSVHGGVCAGGFIFEFSDEWWKDQAGSNHTHDVGGVAPGGGPHPDRTFNEEWWGLVDMDRRPRLAFHAFAGTPLPGGLFLHSSGESSWEPWNEDSARACTVSGCVEMPDLEEPEKAGANGTGKWAADKRPKGLLRR